MKNKQRRKRAELEEKLGRPDPRAVEHDFAHLLATVAPKAQELELHTDKHKDYPKAVKRVRHLKIKHRTISSRAARTADNPLFPINLLDLLIRHGSSNHKRETIAYSKRRVCAAERLAIFLVWRNWMRPYSILKKGKTPAMRLGISSYRISLDSLLDRRYFPSRIELPVRWKEYYGKTVQTRGIPRGRVHALKYAA